MTSFSKVGKPAHRIDAVDKVTGDAQYGGEIRLPGMLFGKLKRSSLPHGRIVNIDTSKAQNVKGVRAIITGEEFARHFKQPLAGMPLRDQPFLAFDRVRYVGEPLAAVAAINEEAAEEAVELIEIEYEPLPALLNANDAMKPNAVVIHEDLANYAHPPIVQLVPGTNICDRKIIESGSLERGFEESDYIFEDTFSSHMIQHVPLEPRVAISKFNPDGSIFVWVSDQSPYGARSILADALNLPPSKIRVVIPQYVGGGFGGKLRMTGLWGCIPMSWKTRYQPVKLQLTREEEFTSTTTRHSSIITLKTGVKKDGTLIARHATVIFDTGAYSDRGPSVLGKACYAAVGPYKIPNIKVDGFLVYTNKIPAGAYRGYGVPQACWAFESQMDIIAHKLNIDPITLRLNNLVDEGYMSATEKTEHHAVGLKECLSRIRECSVDIGAAGNEVNTKSTRRGSGVACGYKISRSPSGGNAIIKLDKDGGVDIFISSVEMGQGVNTIFSQIVSDELGVPIDNIRVLPADTYITPFFPASTSSRTTFFLGNAVKRAAQDIKKQLLDLAEKILKTDRHDLEFENCSFSDRNDPQKRVDLKKIIELSYPGGINFLGHGSYYHYWPGKEPDHIAVETAPSLVWMYGAQYFDIEIDVESGQVHVLKVYAAHDCGKAINPQTCEGQIDGGVANAIGAALFEELTVGDDGRILNPSLTDYKIPVALDMPEIVPLLVEEPHREGPYGAVGIGEATMLFGAPAIANALFKATGVRIKDLPLTQEKILKALKKCKI